MDNAVLKGSAGYGSRCDSHHFSVVRVGREEKLASNSCGTVSVLKKKMKKNKKAAVEMCLLFSCVELEREKYFLFSRAGCEM